MMSRSLFAVILLATFVPGCDGDDLTSSSPPVFCSIDWSGALATDSSVFDVRACWNGRCTGDITIQATAGDAGTRALVVDAGCTPAPATPEGVHLGCRAARTQGPPIAPSAGCGDDEIGDQFSVRACAQTSSDDRATFSVVLTPTRPFYPSSGGTAALTIETSSGASLLATEVTVPSAEPDVPCRGGRFALDGRLLSK